MVFAQAKKSPNGKNVKNRPIDKMAFHKLDKYATNNEATRAIFDHFRNIITCAALYAATEWLRLRGNFHSVDGIINYLSGATLGLISTGLAWIAITNASYRLHQAGFSSRSTKLLWFFYCSLAVAGVFRYTTLH